MDRIYVREGDGLFLGAIKLVFFAPLLAVPIYAAVRGWNAFTALHWHPALIVLAAFVAIGVITAILTALASALPRTTTAIGILYCTAMYGLAAYAITHDPIWTTVIALLTAVISWEPVAAFISRRAAH
jgi:hypothetical protein